MNFAITKAYSLLELLAEPKAPKINEFGKLNANSCGTVNLMLPFGYEE